ncbi:hypothetical protein BS78_K333100 [Paspalum vaginatum]|uniref:Uncharacterized protein n=1 Tax=Paspalum vaginatum TaxID=158149 RepID=A0A9W7XE85_9POAL|nr:hypothetical protein BS78_K333100 [Paspalum vaginatum]KAJ1256695.1 hypothetical protein BS78_K333100 [Paspalum vaginatum]KAJ1256696.1 hypothetical protein BS78_K333100 [Paspalum vaginatum]
MSSCRQHTTAEEASSTKIAPGFDRSQKRAIYDQYGKGMEDLPLSVGIVSPVTKETAGALYHQQMSLQICFFGHMPGGLPRRPQWQSAVVSQWRSKSDPQMLCCALISVTSHQTTSMAPEFHL